MGSYYSQENDIRAASTLPSSEEILPKIRDEIKNNGNHGFAVFKRQYRLSHT